MNHSVKLLHSVLILLLCIGNGFGAAASGSPQLKPMLEIAWKKGPNLPQGFQDSGAAIVGNWLVTTTGFCSGKQILLAPETQDVPGKEGKYPRGFLRKTWGLDLGAPEKNWRSLPDFPGAARQHAFAIAVDDRLYCWGGYSYTEPFTYDDGYGLARVDGEWSWQALPSLPWKLASPGVCAIGSRIYVVGGAHAGGYSGRVTTESNGQGGVKRQGARLLVIDTKNLAAGWKELSPCPGTARMVHATAAVNGRIYVIGGASGRDNVADEYCTIVDNWSFDPASERWERLPDTPVASGNFTSGPIVFADRYLVLVGGYQYGRVLNPDGTTRPVYGKTAKQYANNPYNSDIFVFDTRTNTFGRATALPLNTNRPMEVVRGSEVHLLGGEIGGAEIEGERFGHHPDLYLVGHITLAEPGAR